MSAPDYNVDNPPTLLEAGTLQGRAIGIDMSTIRPFEGRPIFLANLALRGSLDDMSEAAGKMRRGVHPVVAIKAVEEDRSRVPRDGRREARLLAKLDHPNILSLLNAYATAASELSVPRITLFTPYYPHTFRELLASHSFTPSVLDSPDFQTLAESLAFQLLSAVSYLHDQGIAHRDINPNNLVLSEGGRLVLIDFGIATGASDEQPGSMFFEVGTGSYRAPELVFASRDYDAPAIDLWAAAVTLAECFTPLDYPAAQSPGSEDSFQRYYRQHATPPPPPELERKTLFDGGASDFLLAASIFKVCGTPTAETWPEAAKIPNFARFTFASFPPTDLLSHLPHLAPATPLATILPHMLQISAGRRMSAKDAVELLSKQPLAVPDDLKDDERQSCGLAEGGEYDLRALLQRVL
ncbi:CMGC/CDK protein kinase [Rhodotorula toruloides ATCC 204091]|uniref:CMGC/CDK protein kinase n=1 Tax=Rhodotorula toruloides TaxID=5286 RepID=A0A0K3CPQ3_RHOTO|nr:CMGC/CDK protein kinase [Rhodotorula toruloides ATCC 204091]KAK4330712.1 Cyclin-dependent protein kinase PHO85 [Rhodotorula toruloides]PRQ70696.1 CMGC/CDK protein kinase [Rhodotorula toruloides]